MPPRPPAPSTCPSASAPPPTRRPPTPLAIVTISQTTALSADPIIVDYATQDEAVLAATDYAASYDDGGLQPGNLVGTLTSPSDISFTLGPVTFTASGITLQANLTCWVIQTSASGSYDWSYPSNGTGSGTGCQDPRAQSSDSGAT